MPLYGELPILETSTGSKVPGFPVQILNPHKTAVLRLPTTDELMTYMQAQRELYRDLGRRKGQAEPVSTPAADQRLFRAIRIDAGPDSIDFDDAEALRAIQLLLKQQIASCERAGDTYIISLDTIFGKVTHTVSIPFEADAFTYRRGMYRSIDLPHGVEERRFPPEAPVTLYDKVFVSAEGYTSEFASLKSIPPHHKRAVVLELMSALAALDPSFDPNS